MTQVNKLLKVLVTTSMVLGSYACTDTKTIEEYQAQAQSFIQNNDPKSAIIALKNANALDPSNASLRFELGVLYLEQGDYLSAEKELERSQSLGFDSAQVLPELVEVKYKLTKFEDVYTLIENSSILSDSAQIKVLTFAGLSALAQQERSKAVDYIDQANSVTGESTYGQIGKAYLATSEKEIEEALILVNSLIAYAPKITESYLLKGYLLQSTKSYIEAAEAFEKYAQLRPRELQVQFFIAQNYISAQLIDKAEPIVNALVKQLDNHSLANQMKAQISFQQKDYEQAKRYGEKAYQLNRNLSVSAVIAGMSAYYLEDYQQAYNLLIKVDNLTTTQQSINKVLIELQLRLGYENEALQSLNTLIDNGYADTALLTAASSKLLNTGNKTAARELLQESIKLNTDNVEQVINQGILKLKLDDLSGIETLEKALELDPTSIKAESSLALGYLNNKQYDEATAIAQKWQGEKDKEIQGLLLEAEVAHKRKQIVSAKSLLNKVLEKDDKNISALFRLGVYNHQAEDYANAFSFYQKVINIDPLHVNATKGIITLSYKDTNLADKALTLYQDKSNELPENDVLKLNLAYLHITKNQTDKALELLLALKKSVSNGNAEVDLVIGDVYALKEEWQQSLKFYSSVTEKKPNSLIAATKLYENYLKVGDLKRALIEVERISLVYPNSLGLLLTKVSFQSLLNIKPRASDIELLQNNPNSSEHWVLNRALGNQAFSNGDNTLAKTLFEKAYNVEPSSVNVIALSKAIGRSESINSTIRVLNEHRSAVNAKDIRVNAMLANAYLQIKDLKSAESTYLDILQQTQDSVLVLNNLSYIYHEFNNKDKALNYAELAIAKAPNVIAVIDTYVQALLLNQQPALAIKQSDKILAISPGNVDALLHKAKAYIQQNNKEQAMIILNGIDSDTLEIEEKVKKLVNSIN